MRPLTAAGGREKHENGREVLGLVAMKGKVTAALRSWALLMAGGLALAACSHSPTQTLLDDHGHRTQSWRSFGVCAAYGCRKYFTTGLSEREVARVRRAFGGPAETAAEEREAIRRAVAELELIIGPKTGTDGDEPGAAIINFSRDGQMDCIDESFNTTTYLTLMAQDGLLRFHDVDKPLRRGYFLNRWPHNTATVVERDTGQRYAIDSWFHGNGVPPEVVTAQDWLDGWSVKNPLPAVSAVVIGSGE